MEAQFFDVVLETLAATPAALFESKGKPYHGKLYYNLDESAGTICQGSQAFQFLTERESFYADGWIRIAMTFPGQKERRHYRLPVREVKLPSAGRLVEVEFLELIKPRHLYKVNVKLLKSPLDEVDWRAEEATKYEAADAV